ncbi:hypothetical protein SAMN05216564_11610 [Halopenitus persicus]|uniref:NrS-1 polymerase-like HBD domain-containing protein n=2 Tax=Halopenitus persicus TaxID=1048396 RepID=A0A1H3NWS4_9EURY|nr:hypothetical protein [Halopenitus persicus]SDY93143.1 hypothetical protein SAMN05216564_11610 [Halopenitus persicus]
MALDWLNAGRADGIGFVFTDSDPIVGVDLDDCRDPDTGAIDEDAQDIIERLDSYTELSPSGTGYHVLLKGDLPDGRNRRGDIELYDTARFFTVTRNHVDDTPARIARRQDALVAIHREYVDPPEATSKGYATNQTGSGATSRKSDPEASGTIGGAERALSDEELLEKARGASNGDKFERLWRGNTGGYESHSESDMALCCLLAFWTGGDPTWMDELFRRSGLIREKWDEVHYADGATYGEKTIERAIATTGEFYEPDSDSKSSASERTASTTSAVETSDTAVSDAEADSDLHRERAYFAEKTRLLNQRISDLEETIAQKDERIATLTDDVERLKREIGSECDEMTK